MIAPGAADQRPDLPEPGAGPVPALRVGVPAWTKLLLAAAYLLAAVWWTLPPGTPLQGPVVRLANLPFNALGLWQSWDMFAPDPLPIDLFVSFVAELDDGTTVERELTNTPTLGLVTRYTRERWRRFCNDHLRLDENRRLWPGAARWFAARLERETGRRVTRLVLWRHWRPVLPPGPDGGPAWRPEWTSEPFHDWTPEPGG